MTEQLSFDVTPPGRRASRRTQPPRSAAVKWPKNPAKRALAAYQAGDLVVVEEALASVASPQSAERRNLVRGSGDFTHLSDYLTWLHAEVPVWIGKATGVTGAERTEVAERCADVIASGADGMFGPDRSRRSTKAKAEAEPQPSTIRAAVAEALGVLAHRDGGVTFSGQHWCVRPHTGCTGTWDVRRPDLHQVEIGEKARKGAGAHFTPRDLAEEVSLHTLEALVYAPGPLQTWCCDHIPANTDGHVCAKPKWKLKPSAEILALHTADIAVGAGVFLLAAARFLADRVLQAWAGERDERVGDRAEALRLVIDGCLYGVDINPWSVELARLTLSLLAPHTVMPNLTRHLLVGDSLFGVSDLEQVRWMDVLPKRGRTLHTVPHPYTRTSGEFVDAIQAAMHHPRPDLRYPDLWGLFRTVCNVIEHTAFEANWKNPDSAENQACRLASAKDIHDLLTASPSWRRLTDGTTR